MDRFATPTSLRDGGRPPPSRKPARADSRFLNAAVRATEAPARRVWEHAYCQKHQNRRPEHIAAFYNLFHWPEVVRCFAEARKAPQR